MLWNSISFCLIKSRVIMFKLPLSNENFVKHKMKIALLQQPAWMNSIEKKWAKLLYHIMMFTELLWADLDQLHAMQTGLKFNTETHRVFYKSEHWKLWNINSWFESCCATVTLWTVNLIEKWKYHSELYFSGWLLEV